MDSIFIRETASGLGATVCGIGSVDRFMDAPKGFHPNDVLPSCRSVIVLGRRFNISLMNAVSTSPYTVARNDMAHVLDHMATSLAEVIADLGFDAVPIGSIGPDEYDEITDRFRGTISLKHAAVLCGLGKLGKNTLLINEKYGNLLWLCAVLTSAELISDPIAAYEGCIKECRLCVDNCPVGALTGEGIVQLACHKYAFGAKNGGEWKIHCFTCRKICPMGRGKG